MRARLTKIAVLSLCLISGCGRHRQATANVEACVYTVSIYHHNESTNEFERIKAVGHLDASIPGEIVTPEYLDFGKPLRLKTTGLTRSSVDFVVELDGETKSITADSGRSSADFSDGQWRVEIKIDATTLAPFAPASPSLPAPVSLYVTEVPFHDGASSTDHIRGRAIAARTEIEDQQLIDEIRSLLSNPRNFYLSGADCFHPRTALSFGTGDQRTDLLFCRECSWVYVYALYDGKPQLLKYGLGEKLHRLVDSLRSRYFPDREDAEDA